MTQRAIEDLRLIETYPRAPVKRAAYSDRTAWLMAVLSELAYTRFDQDDDSSVLSLARDLAELRDGDLVKRLQGLTAMLGAVRDAEPRDDNALLREALGAGGFELKGVLFDAATDTQGYVAVRRSREGHPGMAVLAFRGTQQVTDWMTNLNAATTPVSSSGGETLGNVHRGFNEAFLSVHDQIDPLLEGDDELPLFITGHSLGGALATLATWYLKGDNLAACYTFGAPRVGDTGLMDRFRTPIYRIVNGVDPVHLCRRRTRPCRSRSTCCALRGRSSDRRTGWRTGLSSTRDTVITGFSAI